MIIGTLPSFSTPMASRSNGFEDALQKSPKSDPPIMADCNTTSCTADEEVYLLVLSKRCHVTIIHVKTKNRRRKVLKRRKQLQF
jgi:hypothetical protein